MSIYMRIYEVGKASGPIEIKGSVSHQHHRDWIELEGFSSTAATQKQASTDTPTSGGAANASANGNAGAAKFSVSKRVDAGTCRLMEWLAQPQPYDIEIHCCTPFGELADPYLRVLLSEARITNFKSAASGKHVTENLEFIYSKLTTESMTRDSEGRLTPMESASTGATGAMSRAEGKAVLALDGSPETAIETEIKSEDAQQEDRLLLIDSIQGKYFELASFSGVEEVSAPFEFRLELISDDVEIDPKDIIGQKVSFTVEDDSGLPDEQQRATRAFSGYVREFRAGLTRDDRRRYSAVVVPWLWFLEQRTNCRIFQQKTAVQVIEAVFDDLGFSDYKLSLNETYPELEFCVQYRETDFDFVQRLMEEAGIFYYFSHTAQKHEMVLGDATTAYAQCDQREVIQTSGSAIDGVVRAWSKKYSHVSGKTLYRDYNFTTPSDTLEVETATQVKLSGIDKYELFDYPGRYPDVSGGRARATVRMQEEEASYEVAEGTGTCDAFGAGQKFKFKFHDCAEEAGQEYVLMSVRHKAVQLARADKERITYTNSFQCIPKKVLFRPKRTTPRPSIPGPQTAKVVGASGEEIDTDKYGCVKVKFRWDRTSEENENSSCWVRVVQAISGKNWGALTLPRIGQEVVVEFLDGDPDRPLVTGSLYNAELMPPYDLPTNKTQSGFKSRSTKEGKVEDFNELRFEDKKDAEHIYFHAQKDFERIVENNDDLTVGKDGEGSQTQTVEKDQTITINEGKRALTVKKGAETIDVDEGDRTVTIGQGKHTLQVKNGDNIVLVDTGNDAHTIKSGDRTVDIKQGNETLTLDMGDATTTLKMGNMTTKLDLGKSSTEAMQGIELTVGGNSIKIDQSGITIKGMMVKIEGTVMTEVKGTMCTVKGDAMLQVNGGITMIG